MEIYFTNNKLYIDVNDRVDFSLINRLKKKLYKIVDTYKIFNIEMNILSNDCYDFTLIDELIDDFNSKYDGFFIVR